MTLKEAGELTPYELINLWHGYIWRRQQQENMLASLVTTWIANSAGKSYKKKVTVADVLPDGRFKNLKLDAADRAIIDELYGR